MSIREIVAVRPYHPFRRQRHLRKQGWKSRLTTRRIHEEFNPFCFPEHGRNHSLPRMFSRCCGIRVFIREDRSLRFAASIGVFDHERERPHRSVQDGLSRGFRPIQRTSACFRRFVRLHEHGRGLFDDKSCFRDSMQHLPAVFRHVRNVSVFGVRDRFGGSSGSHVRNRPIIRKDARGLARVPFPRSGNSGRHVRRRFRLDEPIRFSGQHSVFDVLFERIRNSKR